MRDLSTLLRDHVEDLAPPVRYDEVVVARRGWRPPFGLVAAVMLVAVGLAAVALRSPAEDRSVISGPYATTAAALEDEGTGAAVVGGDVQLRLTEVDTGDERVLGPLPLQCGTCPLLRIGESIYAGSDFGIFAMDPPTYIPRKIADANLVFASSVADELFVATTNRDHPNGTDVRRITTTGAPLGGPWPVPDGYWLTSPSRVTARGIILESPPNTWSRTFTIWDPATGRMGPLGKGTRLIDTHVEGGSTRVARVTDCGREHCPLAITDLASGQTREVDAPGSDVGFMGGGGFSPDGTKLAAFSVLPGVERRARLVIVDVSTGRVRPVERSTLRFGEAYGFATWAPNGNWVFSGGLDQLLAHRNGARDAAPVDAVAQYSAVAVTAPADPPIEELEDGRHFGFLKAIDVDRRTLVFDLAAYTEGAEEPIRNENQRLRVLRYSRSVSVTAGRGCRAPTDAEVCGYLAYDLRALVARVQEPDAPLRDPVGGVWVWLTVDDGVVTVVENPYFS